MSVRMDYDAFKKMVSQNKNLSFVITAGPSSGPNVIKVKDLIGENEEKQDEPKKSKHKNIRMYTFADGFSSEKKSDAKIHGLITACFDSKKEFNRWQELQLLLKAKKIKNLDRQVPFIVKEGFEIDGKKFRPIIYKADFVYDKDGKKIIEDVKGVERNGKVQKTDVFSMKWKMMQEKYPEYTYEIY